MNEEEKNRESLLENLKDVPEATRTFKYYTDRDIIEITNDETNECMVEISGYDLKISFNMEHLKSMEEVEAACDGIRQLFKDEIMKTLLSHVDQK